MRIDFLKQYQETVENALKGYINAWSVKSALRDACEYALLNGGKRFRPILVLLIAKSLPFQFDATQAALAVEFFHTASLIADDLPCMDDEELRRQKPALHKAFGEATAILASYSLIAAGYELLAANGELLKQKGLSQEKADRLIVLAMQNVSVNMGLNGASAGQYFDIYPSHFDLAEIFETIRKKTVTLFEISFVLGWLFGGGNPEKIDQVKNAAKHFGMAFQIADDFIDAQDDALQDRKINTVNLLGKNEAQILLDYHLESFTTTCENLELNHSVLFEMLEQLKAT